MRRGEWAGSTAMKNETETKRRMGMMKDGGERSMKRGDEMHMMHGNQTNMKQNIALVHVENR